MTEPEWLSSTNPRPMLEFLGRRKASDRKVRLFGAACFRRIWGLVLDEWDRAAVELAEKYADGEVGRQELEDGRAAGPQDRFCVRDAIAYTGSYRAAWLASQDAAKLAVWDIARWEAREIAHLAELDSHSTLLRDVFGPLPFRLPAVERSWLAWNDEAVVGLAQAAYDNRRLPAGTLDGERLAVLADALEEAGCADAELLGHLRGPGPHVRGCWVVDLVLKRK
jgi:hypothetical protein